MKVELFVTSHHNYSLTMSKTKVQNEKGQTKTSCNERISWFQQEAILQWLEIELNFNWLNGEATKGMKMVVAGAKVSKNWLIMLMINAKMA